MSTSYIQITQENTFPSASYAGKVVVGVNASNQVVVTDSSGISTPITGSIPPYTASYKVYSAKLSDNLSASIQENTLGFTPEWNNGGSGRYSFNFSGSFDPTKIVSSISPNSLTNINSYFVIAGAYDVTLYIVDNVDEVGQGQQIPIEIRQYL